MDRAAVARDVCPLETESEDVQSVTCAAEPSMFVFPLWDWPSSADAAFGPDLSSHARKKTGAQKQVPAPQIDASIAPAPDSEAAWNRDKSIGLFSAPGNDMFRANFFDTIVSLGMKLPALVDERPNPWDGLRGGGILGRLGISFRWLE